MKTHKKVKKLTFQKLASIQKLTYNSKQLTNNNLNKIVHKDRKNKKNKENQSRNLNAKEYKM